MKRKYLVVRFLVAASAEYAWRSLKNGIKLLAGRKICFDERGLFLRQYVLHLTGLRPIRKITSTGLRGEGAGSQALMIMNAINFARSFGLTYVHTPFTHIHHAERPMKEWVAAWETTFNLAAGEAICDVERHDVVNFCHNFEALDLCFGWRGRRDELADCFKAIIPEFRGKYYLNKSPRTTEEVTVGVHIRRGNTTSADPDYFTSNETILRTIAEVKSILDACKVRHRICIYSQGERADFAEFSLPGVEFFLDVDAVWTMQELIEADVLIVAKGLFSYYAALISDGIKILEPLTMPETYLLPSWKWRSVPAADSWLLSQADGSFDRTTFERQLLLIMDAKAATLTKASAGRSGHQSQ